MLCFDVVDSCLSSIVRCLFLSCGVERLLVAYILLVVCCSVIGVWCKLFVVWCLSFVVVRCALFVVCCLLFLGVGRCWLFCGTRRLLLSVAC